MTEAIEKLIAAGKKPNIHTDLMLLPKLAEACEVLLDGMKQILSIAECHGAGVFSDPSSEAISRANEIALSITDERQNTLTTKTDEK